MPAIHCLVIDDDADDRDFFDIALEGCGQTYTLTQADNGLTALELLNQTGFAPAYIFLDLNMPMLSGKECLKRIREIAHHKNTPVIIYSTSSYHKDVDDTKALGATNFLTKTPDIDKLSAILSQIFSTNAQPFVLS